MIEKAFLLGAGLGTRLRPLTADLPKPLVPLFHRPLIEWAMESCARAGIREFAINTHHRPEAWTRRIRESEDWEMPQADARAERLGANGVPCQAARWRGLPVTFFHEPTLLETGGGLRNLGAWIGDDPLLVHNGDIFSEIDLGQLMRAHAASGSCPVTLAVRSGGIPQHLQVEDGRVRDIRGRLGRGPATHGFTGIYAISPELLRHLPEGERVSVIPAFVDLAREGRLAAWMAEDGHWIDLGDLESYLRAHRTLRLAPALHPKARISADAVVVDSVIGPGAEIGTGAKIERAVVWPGAKVPAGAQVLAEVVRPTAAPSSPGGRAGS